MTFYENKCNLSGHEMAFLMIQIQKSSSCRGGILNASKLMLCGVVCCLMISLACSIRRLEPENRQSGDGKAFPDSWEKTIQRADTSYMSSANKDLLRYIAFYLGSPYREGGLTRTGFDCSGLVVRIFYDAFGIMLPHNSYALYQEGKLLGDSDPKIGDLLFFKTGSTDTINHVGIYIIGTRFVHASSTRGVVISDLRSDYYRNNFAGIRRIDFNPVE